ncbi:helix-turn-helix domain-containing protein [Dyella psychrodurans]|uniref:helix-turn-helix domain-containing protein n=1 Tax=Dyella psychrodurans TaxID=1927960 RepID=UPI0011C02E34|nr:helix-turn-helix domain-containing protein [Dyella psychrodurans]
MTTRPIATLHELHQARVPTAVIACVLGVRETTVLRALQTPRATEGTTDTSEATVGRARSGSSALDAPITALWLAGRSVRDIADEVGRSAPTIRRALVRLGLAEPRRAR